MDKELEHVLEKYLPDGIVKGSDLLLAPEKMLSFIDDLAKAGVSVGGCEAWRYLDPHKKDRMSLMELAGAGMLREHPVPPEILTPEMSADQVKDFITNRWPDDADLVALIFLDGEIYDYFHSLYNIFLDEYRRGSHTSV